MSINSIKLRNVINPICQMRRAFTALGIAILAFAGGLLPNTANADFIVVSRFSELSVNSTNLGGVTENASTTDLAAPFQIQFDGTTTHIEPGGNLNGGFWIGMQNSTINDGLIQSQMHNEVIVQQLAGQGSAILDIDNLFEVDFEVTEETEIELSGSYFGDAENLGAHDFVRVQMQWFNGVTFITMFSTTAGDSLDTVYTETLIPGRVYRLSVESRAYALGDDVSVSNVNVCLRPEVILADLNGDGLVNLLDVDPFIDAIASGNFVAEADTNCDGEVNLLDVNAFIAILAGN